MLLPQRSSVLFAPSGAPIKTQLFGDRLASYCYFLNGWEGERYFPVYHSYPVSLGCATVPIHLHPIFEQKSHWGSVAASIMGTLDEV